MHLCILENDDLDPPLAQRYTRVAAMFERLFAQAVYQGRIDTFSARHGQYPASFVAYDAVLLTGSRADAFSDEPRVSAFLLGKRRALMGEPLYEQSMGSLAEPHDGLALARS